MSTIRVLLVDDEAPARRKLRRFLIADPDFEVIGEAGSAADARVSIERLRPDVMFLDVQMPGASERAGTGFEALRDRVPPYVVFVTAHEGFALKAFEVQAFDYLLKPVDRIRFEQLMARLKRRIRQEQVPAPPREYAARILIDTGERAFFVAPENIARITSDRNYLDIRMATEVHRVRATLDAFALQLDPRRFLRLNRSELANVDFIEEMRPWFHGEQIVLMKDGAELRWTRRYKPGRPAAGPGSPESVAD